MTAFSPQTLREQWLIHTLYGQRGHFREEAPAEPSDLSTLPSGQEGMIVQCNDGRQMEERDRKLGRGEAYIARALGAKLEPGNDDPVIIRAMTPVLAQGSLPRYASVIGHEFCGANESLLKLLVTPEELSVEKFAEATHMAPAVTQPMEDALTFAHARGASWKKLHDAVIRSTALYSVEALNGMHVNGQSVKKLADGGMLHVNAGVRGMVKKDGNLPLAIFDPSPDFLTFRPVEDIYGELLSGKPSEAAITARMNDMLTDKKLFAPGASVALGHSARVSHTSALAGQTKLAGDLNRER